MKHTLPLLAALLSGLYPAALPAALGANSQRPNIVYILADDLGYGDVKCLGGERSKIATPNIDRLAAAGMIFTEAHSSSAVCTPTRYGILTGRYNWRSWLQASVLGGYNKPLIAEDRLTVPGFLKQNGYATACIGKWHLGFTVNPPPPKGKGAALGAQTLDGPVTRGFDYFYGFHHAEDVGGIMKSVFINDRVTEIVEPVDMLPKLTRQATDYIDKQAKDGHPFFLYLALNSPHAPIVPTKEWQGKSGLNAYGDFVMETDWAVGEVLAALAKAGISNDTLVIFTSDNGCSPVAGVKELEGKGHYPSELRRGYKSDIWDGGHRVPFIARWPGTIEPATRSDQLICLTDLMATCADILQVKLPESAGVDSVSVLPALTGVDKGPLRETIVHHSKKGNFAIRQGNWKLVLCPGSGGWGKGGVTDAPGQLYDMSKDISEQTNEYNQHPEIVSRLTTLLEKYVADGRSTPGPKQKNDAKVDIWKLNAQKKGPPTATESE